MQLSILTSSDGSINVKQHHRIKHPQNNNIVIPFFVFYLALKLSPRA